MPRFLAIKSIARSSPLTRRMTRLAKHNQSCPTIASRPRADAAGFSSNLPGDGGYYVGFAIVFVGLWRIGLYLHGHRDFVSTLWSLDAALLR